MYWNEVKRPFLTKILLTIGYRVARENVSHIVTDFGLVIQADFKSFV